MNQSVGSTTLKGEVNITCGKCGNIDNINSIENKGFRECESCGNTDNFIILDEMISPTILLLNKKGYKTLACCMGHTFKEKGYIAFDNIHENILPYFTKHNMWRYEQFESEKDVIRWNIEGTNFIEKSQCIVNWAEKLYEMACKLPCLETNYN